MKTSELAGQELNNQVALAHGWTLQVVGAIKSWSIPGGDWESYSDFQPSSDWTQAGPIIEREKVHIAPMPGKGWAWCACVVSLETTGGPDRGAWMEGRTPLIAAMRAFVASKFGRETPSP